MNFPEVWMHEFKGPRHTGSPYRVTNIRMGNKQGTLKLGYRKDVPHRSAKDRHKITDNFRYVTIPLADLVGGVVTRKAGEFSAHPEVVKLWALGGSLDTDTHIKSVLHAVKTLEEQIESLHQAVKLGAPVSGVQQQQLHERLQAMAGVVAHLGAMEEAVRIEVEH